MRNPYLVVLAIFFLFASSAYAASGYQLAQKHMCTACHSLDRKLIGPPWMSVSAMYKDKADAETYLMGKIRSGGTGTWGIAHMPPTKDVSDEELKILAQYILKLSKE